MFIVSDEPSEWPATRMMTSTGLRAENTPENIAIREPTDKEMRIISTREAEQMFGKRVWPVEGLSVCLRLPSQLANRELENLIPRLPPFF